MKDILKKSLEENVNVHFLDIKEDGFFLEEFNIIIINSNLTEEEQKLVLLHELAHSKKHREQACLYNRSFSNHSKMEAEANEFMLHFLLEENEGAFNYTNIVENFGLSMGEECILK